MTRRDRHEVAYAVVELEDARDELRSVALCALGGGATTTAAMRERLQLGTQAVEDALERLADVQARLEQHVPALGLPVSEASRYLVVSEPTGRAWLRRDVLARVPDAKPVLVEIASLGRVGRALAELRERGHDRDWTRALVDLLHDRAERGRPELVEGLDELRRGVLAPRSGTRGSARPERRSRRCWHVGPGTARYDAAVQALRGEGCHAGGKRLAALDKTDYPMCQRALYGPWRMTTVYRSNGSIVIVSGARHTRRESPSVTLAEIFPGLSETGRRRSEQPPCCDDPAAPPSLSAALDAILLKLVGN
jgi:hypothetical protein